MGAILKFENQEIRFVGTAEEITTECLKEAGISEEQTQASRLTELDKYSQGIERLVFDVAKRKRWKFDRQKSGQNKINNAT